MRLALYSPRPAMLEQQREILAEFNATACLDLEIDSFDSYDSLFEKMAQYSFDALFYDMEEAGDPSQRLLRLRQIISHCPLVLLGGSENQVDLQAAARLTVPLDGEEYLALLTHLIWEVQYG